MSETLSLGEIQKLAFQSLMSNVHTAIPGRIEKDNGDGTVDVKPLLKRKYKHEEAATDLPVIPRVPLIFPRLGNGWIRFPVNKGDGVQLLVNERSIETWYSKGGVVDPLDSRKFSLSDAVAFPGLNPEPKAIKPKGAKDSVEVALNGAYIEITSGGKFKVTGNGVELLDLLDQLLQGIIEAKTNTMLGPMPWINVATFTQIKSKLAKIKS